MGPADATKRPRKVWWIRVCRLSWFVLRFFWVTIVVGLLLNGTASLIFLSQGTNLRTLFIGRMLEWANQHLFLLGLDIIGIAALTVLTWVGSHQKGFSLSQESSTTHAQQSRFAFTRIARSLYTKELTQSLQGAALLVLGLHERFDITRSPTQMVFRRADHTEHPHPPGTTIRQIYDDAGGGLLILGEPGAGKSTLLLELALSLLERVEQEITHPVPVIFNLSSWASKRLPLDEWLVEELLLRYNVPRRLAQTWIQMQQLLPLLDGLDEVAQSARSACIDAINTYRGEHFVPLVVCSRSQEYLSQETSLALPSAVTVQPLTRLQVKEYLTKAGKPLAALRTVLRTNAVLYDLITTPLMLNVVILTYQGKLAKDLPQNGAAEAQQRQIFAQYVRRMLEQRGDRGHYKPERTINWLIWLARQMRSRSQSVFYLEQLQPDWMVDQRKQYIYQALGVLLPGILIGALISLRPCFVNRGDDLV